MSGVGSGKRVFQRDCLFQGESGSGEGVLFRRRVCFRVSLFHGESVSGKSRFQGEGLFQGEESVSGGE